MSAPRRHAPRSRRHRPDARLGIDVGFDTDLESFHIWTPDPDDPIMLTEFNEAAMLAFDAEAMPLDRELLVLLDEHRRVTAMLLDPPAPLGVMIGRFDVPGLDVPFCQTLSIVIVDHIDMAPPNDDDRAGYLSLRRIHMLQGLQLLDVILVDGDRVQSLAISCDPDPVWFDPFEPYDHAA